MKEYLKTLQKKFLDFYSKSRKNVVFRILFKVAAVIYYVIYKTRLTLYKLKILKSNTLSIPVISIGNITLGGTGKTPLVIEIATYLTSLGYKVGVLSRGYKRKLLDKLGKSEVGNILVCDGEDIIADADICGDEPYLIAKKIPKVLVIVNKNRIAAGEVAIRRGAEILILDDGYQYLRLNRDENILVINGDILLEEEKLFPCGTLRENVDSIDRATSIVISNSRNQESCTRNLNLIKKYTGNKPIVSMKYKIKQLKGLNIKKNLTVVDSKSIDFIGFCGIGNPDSFKELLREYEIKVLDYLIFPDHHSYTYSDIKKITDLANKYNIENVITTEKDAIKIENIYEAESLTFWAVELNITLDSNAFERLFVKRNNWFKKG